MIVDLRNATATTLAAALFDHEVAAEGADPWYFGDVDFQITPDRQIRVIAELFHGAPAIFSDYAFAQVEEGLWCMMGDVHSSLFTALVWNSELSLADRLEVVAGVYPLYDQLLAASPYEPFDFRHADATERRFKTIDYMAPDLLLVSPWFRPADPDTERVKTAFLDLFARLLAHDAPVAQYAGLHGLGHLEHPGREDVIDRYLAAHPKLDDAQRLYAGAARRGVVL